MTDQTLHLNLKGEYFDQIAAGTKLFEYRLRTEYWRRRLQGRSYQRVLVKKGYPRAGDPAVLRRRPGQSSVRSGRRSRRGGR